MSERSFNFQEQEARAGAAPQHPAHTSQSLLPTAQRPRMQRAWADTDKCTPSAERCGTFSSSLTSDKGEMAQLGHCKGQPTEPLPEQQPHLCPESKWRPKPEQCQHCTSPPAVSTTRVLLSVFSTLTQHTSQLPAGGLPGTGMGCSPQLESPALGAHASASSPHGATSVRGGGSRRTACELQGPLLQPSTGLCPKTVALCPAWSEHKTRPANSTCSLQARPDPWMKSTSGTAGSLHMCVLLPCWLEPGSML